MMTFNFTEAMRNIDKMMHMGYLLIYIFPLWAITMNH